MNQISENQLLYDISQLHEDIPMAKWENFLKRCIRDGMREIGLRANTHLHSEIVQVEEDGTFPVGDHVMEIRELLLVYENGNAVEPNFKKAGSIPAASSRFVNINHRPSDSTNSPVVRFDPAARCLFVENINQTPGIDHAIIAFLGHNTNDYGNLMVPDQASTAIKARMDWMVLKRKRNRAGSNVPLSEVEAARQHWRAMAGHARGRVSATWRPRLREMVRENWYRSRYKTIDKHQGK